MLLHLARRGSRAALLAAGAAATAFPIGAIAEAAAQSDDGADTPSSGIDSKGDKRLSPAARAAAILMERRRRKQQEQAEEEAEAARKAAAAAAAAAEPTGAATAPPLPPSLAEPCPERSCRGAQDMLAAFAQVRARLKQKQEEQGQEDHNKQYAAGGAETPATPPQAQYLWWAEALPPADGDADAAVPTPSAPCPPDTAEIGRAAWTVLHSVAAYYPPVPSAEDREALRGLVGGLARLYPCAECRAHLPEELAAADAAAPAPMLLRTTAAKNDDDGNGADANDAASSRALAERWMCELHNAVNVRLGKPPYDCSRVGERWRDGWRDRSCG